MNVPTSLARHPNRQAARIARGDGRSAGQKIATRHPCLEASVEGSRANALMAEPIHVSTLNTSRRTDPGISRGSVLKLSATSRDGSRMAAFGPEAEARVPVLVYEFTACVEIRSTA